MTLSALSYVNFSMGDQRITKFYLSSKELGGNDPHNILASNIADRAKWIQSLSESEGSLESPININLTNAIPLELLPLQWHHLELPPKKTKITNTGHTLILSAKWYQERPFLSDGPFLGNYVFSQIHFHWGRNDMEGSEHTVDGSQHPLEMHAVLFNSIYITQEAALKQKDGVAVLVYFFKLQTQPNPTIQTIIDATLYVQMPHCSTRIENIPLRFLLKKFINDFFLYWGSVVTTSCTHLVLWLICREPIGISVEQLEGFRTILDAHEDPIVRNFRNIQPQGKRRLFHVSPSGSKYATLLPMSRDQPEPQQAHKTAKTIGPSKTNTKS